MTDFTVGDLRGQLAFLPDDTKLSFEGGLTFTRLKRWSDNEFILCFGEIPAELSATFRKRHPTILVAFAEAAPGAEGVAVAYVPRL